MSLKSIATLRHSAYADMPFRNLNYVQLGL
jgi:hypothetical protein